MGLPIDRDEFDDADYPRFSERLAESVAALGQTLALPGFGQGPTTVGAELELFLVDPRGFPLPINLLVLRGCRDPRLAVELSRYNLEVNFTPQQLAGRPFGALFEDLETALSCARAAAARQGARIAFIGILPTLRLEDLGHNALTPLPRFRALNAGVFRSRAGQPLHIHLAREETVSFEADAVTIEGANTSLQFHLRVAPERFADTFNAAQLATAPVLAVAANSPLFLGRKLWDESRVALFRQATDDRGALPADWSPPARVSFGHGWCRRGVQELFAETVALYVPFIPVMSGEQSPLDEVARGEIPSLAELRLHSGTVWSWNRPVYDPHGEGHLRIEFRALPAGPTVLDMMANGAFLIGLTLALAADIERYLAGLPFLLARTNFFRAARDGLDAELLWPAVTAPSPRPVPVVELLPELVELAARGLETAGVERSEYEPLLAIIKQRIARRISGARWQRRMLDELEAEGLPRQEALAELLDRYMELSEAGRPVHEWPVPPRSG